MPVSLAGTRLRQGTRLSLGLAMATWAAWPLAAQATPEGPSWALRALRNSECVRFLIEPAVATKRKREGSRPLRADQDETLHPALRSVITAQPEFAAWTPSSLCFFYADSVTVSGRTIVGKNPKKPQMISVWTVAATQEGTGARRDLVLDLAASSGGIIRAAQVAKLRLQEARASVSRVSESSDELYEIRLGKTRLFWTGRPADDSARVKAPIQESWAVRGATGTWNVTASLSPTWSRPLVGVLRVEGKDDLAKALKSSPIRFVGPRQLGGSGDLLFSR